MAFTAGAKIEQGLILWKNRNGTECFPIYVEFGWGSAVEEEFGSCLVELELLNENKEKKNTCSLFGTPDFSAFARCSTQAAISALYRCDFIALFSS